MIPNRPSKNSLDKVVNRGVKGGLPDAMQRGACGGALVKILPAVYSPHVCFYRLLPIFFSYGPLMVAIVLLPGMHGNAALFGDFVSALGPDMVATIVSYLENEPLGYEDLAVFSQTYLPQNEPFILLGESFSGPVAILLASACLPNLAGVVLCGTFASNPYPLLKPFKCLTSILPVGPSMHWIAELCLFGRFASTRWRNAFRHALSLPSKEVLRARIHAVLDVDCRKKLKKMQVPMLYLQGMHDCVVPASAMRKIAEEIPSMEIRVFEAPHMILQIVPNEAAEAVKKFSKDCLSRLRRTSGMTRSATDR
ncbi:MAG: alpha/beta hydrolase [Burkholderiales bacterium]|nr:alpha/beta hydrolase [Burkholderiales bacterium]